MHGKIYYKIACALIQFLTVNLSSFVEGYWDAGFKVLNAEGHEVDEPLLVAIDGKTGVIYTMEEIIMQQIKK